MRSGAVALLGLLVCADARASAAQPPRSAITASVCTTCTIDWRRVMQLGDPDGPGMLETGSHLVRRDSRGRFYVFNGESPYFWVFDTAGRFVRRVGARGDGPGEFQAVTTLTIGSGDSIFVFEARNRHLTVLSPNFAYVRSGVLMFTSNFDAVAFGNSVVINVDARARDGAQPLRLLTPAGAVARSFGSVSDIYVPNQGFGTRRALAPAGGNAMWVARLNEYAFERWDTNGTRLDAFARDVPWFRAWNTSESRATVPPAPSLVALSQQGDTVWAVLRVPGPDWRTAVAPLTPDGSRFRILDEATYRNTILEAIDLRNRRVIASRQIAAIVNGFASPGLTFSDGTDAAGNPVVDIWTTRVLNPVTR